MRWTPSVAIVMVAAIRCDFDCRTVFYYQHDTEAHAYKLRLRVQVEDFGRGSGSGDVEIPRNESEYQVADAASDKISGVALRP
jgi:hypothetical protein